MSNHIDEFKNAQTAEMAGMFSDVLPKVLKLLPLLKSQIKSNKNFIPEGKTALLGRNGNNDFVILQFDTPANIGDMIPKEGVEVYDIDILIQNIFGVDLSKTKETDTPGTPPPG